MNNAGTVIVYFVPQGASQGALWSGNGESPLTPVASGVGAAVCPSINDLGETAYMVTDASTGHTSLVRNSEGNVTTLANSAGTPPLSGGETYLPSLSNDGSAVYQSQGDVNFGAGIYIGPGGTSVYNAAIDPQLLFFSTGSMNDHLVVAFVAIRPDASAPAGSRIGIYRGSATPFIEDGASVGGGQLAVSLTRPVINNAGTVAFVGSTTGTPTLFTIADDQAVNAIGTGVVDRIAINDAGTVAFRRVVGLGTGIYTGRAGAASEKVIEPEGEIDGSTLVGAFIWEEAINNRGQIAFWAELADGRRGIFRADPIDEIAPVVTPPAPLAVQATQPGGATGSASPTLANFLAAGTATDNVDENPVRLAPLVNGTDATNATVFPMGTSTVTFRFQDASANIGTAESTVTVTNPTCGLDATASVSIMLGGIRFDKRAGTHTQRITLKGSSTTPIQGPVSLVLDNLTAGASLVGATGTTACAAPLGSPYINVDAGSDNELSARERIVVELTFAAAPGLSITYSPRVLSGVGGR